MEQSYIFIMILLLIISASCSIKCDSVEEFGLMRNSVKNMKILSPKKTISILGLSFKKNTDDIRESVSIKIVEECLNYGLKIKVHDSMALTNFKNIFHDKIEYYESIDSCLKKSDCCVILTDSDEYKKLQSSNFFNMNKKNIIDTRRILNHKNFKNTNFHALGLGQFK